MAEPNMLLARRVAVMDRYQRLKCTYPEHKGVVALGKKPFKVLLKSISFLVCLYDIKLNAVHL